MKTIKRLYYRLWLDTIDRFKEKQGSSYAGKFYSVLFINFAFALNSILIYGIIVFGILNCKNALLRLDFIEDKRIEYPIVAFIQFFSPFYILNYFLIFRKDRYLKLKERYPSNNWRLGTALGLILYMIPILILAIFFLYKKYLCNC